MTTIAIVPQTTDLPEKSYRAIAGGVQSEGSTVGQALDALTSKLGGTDEMTLVIVQPSRSDAFFSKEQQCRLEALMNHWRKARDGNGRLTAEEQAELDRLVGAELHAAKERAKAMVNGLAS